MYAAAELNFHIVEGGGEWLTLNWYMTLKGTYFYFGESEVRECKVGPEDHNSACDYN